MNILEPEPLRRIRIRFEYPLLPVDRSVKIWSVDDRSYVETLFGHNDKISAVDAGTRERAVTAGVSIGFHFHFGGYLDPAFHLKG